jgi:hypothetical protein
MADMNPPNVCLCISHMHIQVPPNIFYQINCFSCELFFLDFHRREEKEVAVWSAIGLVLALVGYDAVI